MTVQPNSSLHLDTLMSAARRRIRRFAPADAVEDLLQEALRRVDLDRLESLLSPAAYIVKVARNIAVDERRRRARQTAVIAALEVSAAEICGPLGGQEEDLLLTQLLMAMPPLYRDTFMLNRLEGYTYVEIAERLGISVKTVEYRMSRALALCRKALSEP